MLIYYTTLLFIIGLVSASFLNALLYRIDNEYKYPDIFIKGSHCEKCNKQLNWYELIPVLSYILFKGKCKKCGYSIPFYYPLSELFLGLGFAGVYLTELNPYFYFLVIFLFIMSYFDRLYHGVYKSVIHLFLLFSVIVSIVLLINGNFPSISLLFAIFTSLAVFLTGKVLKKPFGIGDILVLLGLGFVLSPVQYLVFIYIFLILAFVYVVFGLLRRKITLKSKIPLLPFMFLAIVLMVIVEDNVNIILSSYLYL